MKVLKAKSSSIHVKINNMKSNKLTFIAAAGLSIAMLGSCNIYKKYELPTDKSELVKEYGEALEQSVDSAALGNLDWRELFTDPVLQDLIEQALENNTNLKNAKINVDIAHAQLKGAKLAYFPSVALAPNVGNAKYGSNDWSGWSYSVPLAVSWEVDIFAKLLNNKRSAQVAVYQSDAYRQAVRSQIIAAVANCYYSLSTLNSQLNLQRETAELWSKSVDVMKDLKLAGRVNEAAVVQSTAQYYGILASITDTETSIHQLNNTLSLLVNKMPQVWSIPAGAELHSPAAFVAGVPMRQLAARPDVTAAEMSMASAYYATNSARAAFYPGLNITANGGFTNLLGNMIMNPGKFFIQLAGSLAAPLFSRGQNITRLKAAKLQQQQALNSFEYTVMNAASEVSNALTVYEKNGQKLEALTKQTENLEKSVEYTTELLSLGTSTSYLEVLTAQQNLLSSQMGQLNCHLMQSQAVINLYQALGGGR